MLKTYAKWLKGATEKDLDAIRGAMGFATHLPLANPAEALKSLGNYGEVVAEREGFEPSITV